jgi:hypothetical protein
MKMKNDAAKKGLSSFAYNGRTYKRTKNPNIYKKA